MQPNRASIVALEDYRDIPGTVALICRVRAEDPALESRLQPRVAANRSVGAERHHIADAQRLLA